MLVSLSNKYFRLKTKNYAIYIGVNDYDQIFPWVHNLNFNGSVKINSAFILHNLSKEEESEMRNEVGEVYEHQLEYVEFDKDTLKFTKRLENDDLLIEDGPVGLLQASSLLFTAKRSYKNPWKNLIKIRKIKNLL